MKKVIVELLVDEERLGSVNGYEDMDLHDALNSELEVMRENGVLTLDWRVVKSELTLADIFKDDTPTHFGRYPWHEYKNGKKVDKFDHVNHPPHYQTSKGFETIDVMTEYTKGMGNVEAIHTAQVIKYICRWNNKNGVEDLKKADWYLNKLIEYKENE